jgi:energy-coupling factor transporter ATP-binding protein EcfA2
MRLTRLTAADVHGYLPIDVEFFPDLTFLIGLNGSGKTTALRLLMGLLTPAVDELARIEFSEARVDLDVNSETVTIKATREAERLTLIVSGVDEQLTLDASALELLLLDQRRRDEARATPVVRMMLQHSVFARIRAISTPMFLGLERRLYPEDRFAEPGPDTARRVAMRRHYWEESELPTGAVGAGLADVVMLVRDTMSEIRAKQEKLDKELRETLLLSALHFKPSDFTKFEVPNKAAITKYKAKQADFQRAANLLRLPLAEVQQPLQEFFDKMSDLTGELAPRTEVRSQKRKPAKATEREGLALMTWLINKSQVDRILENLDQFETYAAKREALHEPIDRLLDLLNKFLAQSNKRLEITDTDRLTVRLPDGRVRSINALSSGERQLCVMLGHLALNPQLSGSGVFIVDEPELSLHLAWQEMFVRSVRAANTDVQLIFATHSPAIILDDDDHCRALGGS